MSRRAISQGYENREVVAPWGGFFNNSADVVNISGGTLMRLLVVPLTFTEVHCSSTVRHRTTAASLTEM